MFSIFSDELKKILNDAKNEMVSLRHSYIGTEHFVLAILKSSSNIKKLLNDNDLDYNKFKNKVVDVIGLGKEKVPLFIFTPLFKKILEDSIMVSCDLKQDFIDESIVFSLILDEGEGVAYRIFCELGIDINELEESINKYDSTRNSSGFIAKFGINLNDKYNKYGFDPVVGRDNEVNRLIEIILRKNKCNPLLIGAAGVGKTSIVEEFTRRIVNQEVPQRLKNKQVISISMADLVSGTKYRGEFEEKLLKIIDEVEKSNNIILFIDEIHTLVGAGGADGAVDASNIFKPALARGNIVVIGATTIEEYKKYIEDDKALSRRFQKIIVEEPNYNDMIDILKKLKPSYEKFHNVEISDELLEYIVKLSKKYMVNRKEPDRSIDILDEVCSYTTSISSANQKENILLRKELNEIINKKNNYLKNNNYRDAIECRKKERQLESRINLNDMETFGKSDYKIVKKEYINKIIEQKCFVKIYDRKVIKTVFKKLKMKLKEDILRQNEVIDTIVDSCEELFSGENKLDRPISFVLCGSTGTGKNYLAFKIGEELFNGNIIRINFNEFRDEQSISRIIGAPPGYVGYNTKNNIFESLKDKNSSMLIFNNLENAHPKIKSLINQIINNGYFDDSNGYRIDFRNSLIINITTLNKSKVVGFDNRIEESNDYKNFKKVLYFNELRRSDIISIIKKSLDKLDTKYTSQDINNLLEKTKYKLYGAKKINEVVSDYNRILSN